MPREYRSVQIDVTDDVANTPIIPLAGYAGGGICSAATTTLTFYVQRVPDGDFRQAYNADGAITLSVNNSDHVLPDNLFGALALKIVADTTPITVDISLSE